MHVDYYCMYVVFIMEAWSRTWPASRRKHCLANRLSVGILASSRFRSVIFSEQERIFVLVANKNIPPHTQRRYLRFFFFQTGSTCRNLPTKHSDPITLSQYRPPFSLSFLRSCSTRLARTVDRPRHNSSFYGGWSTVFDRHRGWRILWRLRGRLRRLRVVIVSHVLREEVWGLWKRRRL